MRKPMADIQSEKVDEKLTLADAYGHGRLL